MTYNKNKPDPYVGKMEQMHSAILTSLKNSDVSDLNNFNLFYEKLECDVLMEIITARQACKEMKKYPERISMDDDNYNRISSSNVFPNKPSGIRIFASLDEALAGVH